MIKSLSKLFFSLVVFIAGIADGTGQTAIPEVLMSGTIREQMTFLDEKTRIYENYRAIREDMFQMVKKNTLDSLARAQGQILILAGMNRNLNMRIDSLSTNLSSTGNQLKEAINTKNSIKVAGIEINKVAYNSVMWIIIGALLSMLAIGFLAFRRNLVSTTTLKTELNELRTGFEEYRQKTRLEREKMSMDHFNEIKRLKGK